MMIRPFHKFFGAAAFALFPLSAFADELVIVADIAPVASLISQVTGGEVTLIIEPGTSPHDASLRPSQARALQKADAVIWIGPTFSPGLERSIDQLADRAKVVTLLEIEQINYLAPREEAVFEDHDEHGHEHGETDPHAWLDPDIAKLWLDHIATQLSAVDPENSQMYRKNSEQAAAQISDLSRQISRDIASLSDVSLIALHDGFQYFEYGFGLNITAALTEANGASASVSRMADLKAHITTSNAACLISDVSESGPSAAKFAEVLDLPLIALDTFGTNQLPGPLLYENMMRQIAKDLSKCKKS